ncbi:MAG: arginase family protein [Pseudomonadota bacterium]|uniref:arginase family protein n=1 Tax=Sphingomonas sp. ERG5 TaxID=1381597 RepID=UPI000690CB09|nr:arginase family protein [Sphingomonas sp. ERG5]
MSASLPAAGILAYIGRAGDRNDRAVAGVELLAAHLSREIRLPVHIVGTASEPLAVDWTVELPAAVPDLQRLARELDQILSGGRRALTLLPRCAAGLATLPVVAKRRPGTAIVWFDAHGDCNMPDRTGTGYLGGMVLTGAAGLWPTGLGSDMTLDQVILVGSRDLDPGEQELIDAGRIALVECGPDLADRLCAAVAGRPVYLHLDCDVLEPGIVPTEYQVTGGLSLAELRSACAALAAFEVVGAEVAELEAAWPDGTPAILDPLIDALRPIMDALTNGAGAI